LVDTGLETKDLDCIRRTILSVSGVKALHLLRTRHVGEQALADVHIIVNDHASVSEGHQISETVRARLMDNKAAPLADVMVHIDTEEDVDGPSCENLPLRDELERRLQNYFRDIPEARQIEHITLHYLNGVLDIELLLPITVLTNIAETTPLTQRFAAAVAADKDIRTLEVVFH